MQKVYLAVYNTLMTAGWGYVLWSLIASLLNSRDRRNPVEAVREFSWDLACFQSIQIIEVFHGLFGVVTGGSSAALAMLWLGRMVAVLYGSLTLAEKSKLMPLESLSFLAMAGSWAISDTLRFLLHLESWIRGATRGPSVIRYLRVYLPFVLFPLGALGEALQIYSARLVHIAAGQSQWDIPLLIYLFIVFPGGFLSLYIRMTRNHKRQLR